MVVVLANCDLTALVRAHPYLRDARGTPIPDPNATTTERGPRPGSALEQADRTWKLRLDMDLWPVRAGDKITDGVRVWVINADPIPHQIPGVPDVDYVAATATLDPPKVA